MELKYTQDYRLESVLRDSDTDDIPLLFEKDNQNYSPKLADEDEHTLPGDTSLKYAEKALDAAIDKYLNDANTEKNINCANCSTAKRVGNVSRFAAGQHISMPGKYSELVSYRHHAIVSEVKHMSGTIVELELIEFNKQGSTINIYKTINTFDLKNDDICIINYVNPRFPPDEIVKRARSMLPINMMCLDKCEFGNYNPASNNCEHFATWCVLDKRQCLQAYDIRHTINEKMSTIHQNLNGYINVRYLENMLLNSTDEIGGAVTEAIGGLKQGIVLGATAAAYFLYCIFMTCVYVRDRKQGHMCRRCLKRKLWDMWLDFSTFCVASSASYLIMIFVVPLVASGYVNPLAVSSVLLAICLQSSVSKVRKMLQSSFPVDKIEIRTLSEIDVGDVISKRYWGIPHNMIVTEVHEQNKSKGNIKCVHYSLPTWNIFGTRKILEERFPVDLTKEVISKFDCRNLLTYKKEIVVNRARKRVGETKWKMGSSRSDALCYWAKVQLFEDADYDDWNTNYKAGTELKKLELTCIVKKEIHLFNELQPGDTIEFGEKGIMVGKTCLDDGYGRTFEIELIVHTLLFGVHRKKYNIDLNKHTVMVYKYFEAHCRSMKERVSRAESAERDNLRFLSTTRFLKQCILLPTA